MKIKRTLFAFSLLGCSSLVFAGGPNPLMQMPQTTPPSPQHLYIEGQVGYAMRNWQDFSNFKDIYAATGATDATINSYLNGASFTDGKGGLAWGVTLGYEFNSVFSVEGFYSMLSNTGWSNTTTPGADETTLNGTIQTWVAGAALKLAANMTSSNSVFIKIGPAYVNDNIDYKVIENSTNSYSLKNNRIALYIAAGTDISINNEVYLGVQYSYISGDSVTPSSTDEFRSPNLSLITASLGFKFTS